MWWKNPSLLLFQQKKNIDTVNKKEKSQASNKIVDPHKINKTDTVRKIVAKFETVFYAVRYIFSKAHLNKEQLWYISSTTDLYLAFTE